MEYKQTLANAIEEIAQKNLVSLSKNEYPGRFIAIGKSESGKYAIMVYAIEGRSKSSKNRIFIEEPNGALRTAQLVPNDDDQSLIIYDAMLENENKFFAVSNGKQTQTAIFCAEKIHGLSSELFEAWKYEPDSPTFTPRITAIFNRISKKVQFLLLRKSPTGIECERQLSEFSNVYEGYGKCIHTYKQNGDPLPPFEGEPYWIPFKGKTQQEVLENFVQILDNENFVSLAVKFIEIETGFSKILIHNKNK